jgi:hypothetical protein
MHPTAIAAAQDSKRSSVFMFDAKKAPPREEGTGRGWRLVLGAGKRGDPTLALGSGYSAGELKRHEPPLSTRPGGAESPDRNS